MAASVCSRSTAVGIVAPIVSLRGAVLMRDTRVEQANPTAAFSTSVSGGLVFEPQRVLERRAAWLLVRYEGQAAA